MAKSEAYKLTRLQCETQLASQVLGIVTDPLWSTILGFAAVHELRKNDLVGPVADDILYAGIIAINSARTPGLQDLAGKGIELLPTAAAAAGGFLAGKSLQTGGAAAGGALVPTVAKQAASKGLLATAARVALPAGLTVAGLAAIDKIMLATKPAKYKKAWTSIPLWKRVIPGLAEKQYLKNVAKMKALEVPE
ncbi:MAG: hypothetical protein MUP14_05445 [Dehalococcoidia bacterium]|nr:hypothetical protein [Dehalococcoidia bacterium]